MSPIGPMARLESLDTPGQEQKNTNADERMHSFGKHEAVNEKKKCKSKKEISKRRAKKLVGKALDSSSSV